jgi:hypothetical protein
MANVKSPHALIWSAVGLGAGALGWASGALIGSNLARTVLAAMSTAVALGLLARRPRLALVAGLATAGAAGLAFSLGRTTITPLLAWPVAGIVIGLSSWPLLTRTRARLTTIVAAPVLGTLGFLVGTVATIAAGMAANDAVLFGQCLWGGAAGFGLLTLAAVRGLGGRLDRAAVGAGGDL